MSAIFISHSSRDNAVAEEIRAWLAEQGHRSVFLDFDPAVGIPAGRDWEQELYRNIRACRAVLVLCSRHSMASRWCFMEITHARALGKHLFPIKIDDCDLDGVLSDRQVIEFIPGRGDREEALRRLGRGILAAGLDPADAFDWDGSRPPYPGLLAFQEEDAAIFFGRDDEIGEGLDLLNKVRRLGETRLVMILGASGTGKSSLVRAGLLPRLRRDSERWLVVDPFRPRDDSARELAAVLHRAFDRVGRKLPVERIAERIRQALARVEEETEDAPPPDRISEAEQAHFLEKVAALEAALPSDADPSAARYLRLLRAAVLEGEPGEETSAGRAAARSGGGDLLGELAEDLRRHAGRDEARVLLVIDQFEELLGHDPEHPNSRFLRLLRTCLDRADGPLVALGTLRSDFLGTFQKSPALLDVRYESLSLGPMSPEDVAQVIERPAQVAAIELESGLVQALVDDAETEDALPLLAFTLRELHERHGTDGRLRVREYRDRLGGLQGAVARAADEILATARPGPQDEAALRTAFLALVRMTEDGTYARRTARWDDLPAAAHPLLERFVQGRLLVAGSDAEGRTLEVAHEALFRSWGRLVQWLEENAEALRLRHEIQLAARSWEAGQRAEEELWRGGRLARARELMARGDLPLAASEHAFVEASHRAERAQIEAEEARRQRELRRTRRFLAAVSGVALLAVALGVFAFLAQRRATTSAVEARNNAALAAESLTQAERNARQAKWESWKAEGERFNALRNELEATAQRGEALAQRSRAVEQTRQAERNLARTHQQEGLRLLGEGQASQALARLAAAVRLNSADPVARAHVLDLLVTMGPPWPLSPPEVALRPENYLSVAETPLPFVALSGDGRLLAIPTSQGAQVWDGERSQPWGPALEDRVDAIALSLDGRRAVTASRGSAQLWDTTTGEKLGSPLHQIRGLNPASFRPDGRRIVLATQTYAQTLDVPTGEPVGSPLEQDSPVLLAEFSPDGRRILTAAKDGAVQLWDAESGEKVGPALQPEPPVQVMAFSGPAFSPHAHQGMAFSPDGHQVVTYSFSGIPQAWDTRTGKTIPLDPRVRGGVLATTFLPNGLRLALRGDQADIAEIWDAATGVRTGSTSRHGSMVQAAAFRPDGLRVVTVTENTTRVSEVDLGNKVPVFEQSRAEEASFSPDGSRVVTFFQDRTARVWDVETRLPVGKTLQHSSRINFAAFSPDGRYVVTAAGKTAQVWDARTGEKAGPPLDHEYRLFRLSFSFDGRYVVTAAGFAVRVWDPRTGEQIRATTFPILSEVSPVGGRLLVSAPGEPTMQILDGVTGEKIGPPLAGAPAEFSATGRQLITQNHTSIRVLDVRTGEAIGPPIPHAGSLASVKLGAEGRRVATLRYDSAQIWDVATGQRVGVPLQHGDTVYSAAFSTDGRRIVTASNDDLAQVWDAESGEKVGPPLHHDRVLSTIFSRDGRRVLSVGGGMARVWATPIGSEQDSDLLAEAAEAVAGYSVTGLGVPAPLKDRPTRFTELRADVTEANSSSDVAQVLRWYLAHPWTRTISPQSRLTVPEFILRFPEQAKEHFPGHPLTRLCVWPDHLDAACVGEALDILVGMELNPSIKKENLLRLLATSDESRDRVALTPP